MELDVNKIRENIRAKRSRKLLEHEYTVPINGIPNPRAPYDVELCTYLYPQTHTVEGKIDWCIKFLEIYGYDVIKKFNL